MNRTCSRSPKGNPRLRSLVFGALVIGCGAADEKPSQPALPRFDTISGPTPTAPSLDQAADDETSAPNDGDEVAPAPTTSGEMTLPPALAPMDTPEPSSGNSPGDEASGNPPAAGATPVATHGKLHVDGPRLVDEHGSPVQLRGISTMWLNWEDRYSASREALRWMRDEWGVSVIRAAMGVEPNGAYLTDPEQATERLRRVVQNAIDVGVYVLVDWHDHHAELHREQAIDFFTQIAREFGEQPNVLYETFNEPLNSAWSTSIKPYHEAVLAAIRAEDPDNVAILGTRPWSQRVDEAARDPVAGSNLMYTVHFYACDHQGYQLGLARAAHEAGLPLFVTEWGATPADGGAAEPMVCEADATTWLDWMNEYGISWAAWKLDGCRDSSCFFRNRQAPVDGGWTDEWLNGHARFVVDRLRD